jgi:hypothetical protein
VKKQISQLFPDPIPIFISDRIRKLIGFFNGHVTKGIDSLFLIPGTFFTQLVHDSNQSQKRIG